ncbi:MAG TPA: peptidylprolyl isomerase [Chloroflexota bacterium]|nr:peptidylprolyl isomerase [Chloroflexota bacterium]
MLDEFKNAGQRSRGEKQWGSPPNLVVDPAKSYTATLETSKGTIEIALLAGQAPRAVNNFIFLAVNGFYDNVKFHRVIKGFMIQTGDPTGTGRGGPGYKFEDEPVTTPYTNGTVAMANAGPHTNGSQFFIVQGPSGTSLPPNYTIFGQVTAGQDVVDAIAGVPVAGPERSSPTTPVEIRSVSVREV